MRSYLIVANQTLASPTLAAAVAERMAAGDATFHVVVPATPVSHGLTWDETEAEAAARERLDDVLARLRAMGVEATGEVGCKDPVDAVRDALRGRQADEIILSTLPVRLSRWLGQDVPSKLRRGVDIPVEVVIAPDQPAEPAAVADAMGVEATGEVGCKDPVDAVRDALRGRQADEIILSTLPVRLSRWLGQDVPSKLRRGVDIPVEVVIAPDQPAEPAAVADAGTGDPPARG